MADKRDFYLSSAPGSSDATCHVIVGTVVTNRNDILEASELPVFNDNFSQKFLKGSN
jgi:hypothetical protein